MINLNDLKENKDWYKKSFKDKGINLDIEINKVLELYSLFLKNLKEEEETRFKLNKISKNNASNLLNNNEKENAKILSNKAKKIKLLIIKLEEEIKSLTSLFPNPPFPEVPLGKDENENIILYSKLDEKKINEFAKPHWEIIEKRKMILLEETSYISGTRHIIYEGKTALVVKALEKFMIDNAIESNFLLIEPPVIVNKESLYNTGQLPKFEEDLYKISENQYLIPTAEVPLTNLVAGKIIDQNKLPIKFVAGTNCFRKEAGSAGKDTRGLIRLHQFRKVELVMIGKPEDEEKDFNEILSTATRILDKLEIPYRVMMLCSGDLSFSSKKTIDIEVWMPGVEKYREISSVSSMGDFQSRRMKARYKNLKNKKELVYTYNGSALAIERTLAAIIENNIQKNGMIKVPNSLKPYLNFKEF